MAVEPLVLPITGDSSGYDKSMVAVERAAARSAAKIVQAWQNASTKQAKATQDSVSQMEKAYAGLGTAAKAAMGLMGLHIGIDTIKELGAMSEQYSRLEKQIKSATMGMDDWHRVQEKLFEISQKTGNSMADTVELFKVLPTLSSRFGASMGDITKVVKEIETLGLESGATTDQLKGASQSLVKMLEGSNIQAKQFKTVITEMPALAREIADGLGMSVPQLMDAVAAGKVLSKDVFAALVKQADDVGSRLDGVNLSISRAGKAMHNSMEELAGVFDRATGASSGIAAWLKEAAKDAKQLADWLREPQVMAWLRRATQLPGAAILNAQENLATRLAMVGMSPDQAHQAELDMREGQMQRFRQIWNGSPVTDNSTKSWVTDNLPNTSSPVKSSTASWLADALKGKAAKGPTNNLASYLADQKAITRELELQAQHQKGQSDIEKMLYAATKAKGAELSAQEKAQVANLGKIQDWDKAELEYQKQIGAEKDKQAKTELAHLKAYQDLGTELTGLVERERTRADQGGLQVEFAKQELELRQKMKGLDPQQQAGLVSTQKAYEKYATDNAMADFLKPMQQEDEELQNIIAGREHENDLLRIKRDLIKTFGTDLGAQKYGEAEAAYNKSAGLQGGAAIAQYAKSQRDTLNDMIEQNAEAAQLMQHHDDIASIMQAEYEATKKLRDTTGDITKELTLQQKSEIARNALEQQHQRDLGKARDLLDGLKTDQQKYNDYVAELNRLWQQGCIPSIQQYQKAAQQADPAFQKLRTTAQQIGSSFERAFDSAVLGGGKLSDVIKGLGTDLARIAEQKLLFDPFEKGLDSLVAMLYPKKQPGVGNQPGQPQGGLAGLLGGAFGNFTGLPGGTPAAPAIAYNSSFPSATFLNPQFIYSGGNPYGNGMPGGGGAAGGYGSPLLGLPPMSPSTLPYGNGGASAGGNTDRYGNNYGSPNGASSSGWNSIADSYEAQGLTMQAALARNVANGTLNGGGAQAANARDTAWSSFANNIWNNTAGLGGITGLSAGGGGYGYDDYGMQDQSYGPQNPNRPSAAGVYGGGNGLQQGGTVGPYFNRDVYLPISSVGPAQGMPIGAGYPQSYEPQGFTAQPGNSAYFPSINKPGGQPYGGMSWEQWYNTGLQSLFAPRQYASGGDYAANMPRLIGENGPELDIPSTSGTVIPNSMLNGSAPEVHIHNNVGAQVTQQVSTVNGKQVVKVFVDAVADSLKGGGALAQAFQNQYQTRRRSYVRG